MDRLTRLGVPGALAEIYADRLDWHQVARLVQRGCPPRLALRIASDERPREDGTNVAGYRGPSLA